MITSPKFWDRFAYAACEGHSPGGAVEGSEEHAQPNSFPYTFIFQPSVYGV